MKNKLNSQVTLMFLSFFLLVGVQSCKKAESQKHKIMYVNSYHQEFPPSAEITAGVHETLSGGPYEVSTYFMDTKRNPDVDFIEKRASELLDKIQEEEPDLLIVSDDNAVKFLVEPNPQIKIPIVFCGVNWSAEQYDLSQHNITGILEILPVQESLETMKAYYPSIQNLLVLNENTTTSRKTKPLLDAICDRVGISVDQELVDDFESWKAIFKKANETHDLIYLQTRGAIKGWDHEEAVRFIDQHIRVPLITCESFMMPYAVIGLTQVSKEQGLLAARAAMKILEGAGPADIPVSRNQQSKVWINRRLAEKIEFTATEEMLGNATVVE